MRVPDIRPNTRLMVIAPHPDDESIAAGGLLQQACKVGAHSRVVFITDGDNNPWPQRVMEHRLRIGMEDRARFGRVRRNEAIAALAMLGIDANDAVFLGFPDQGVSSLLFQRDSEIVDRLAAELRAFRPDMMIVPSLLDIHGDHSATGVIVQAALDRCKAFPAPIILPYIVHSRGCRPEGLLSLPISDRQREVKRAAILCHSSQLVFRRRSLLARANGMEQFTVGQAVRGGCEQMHPVRRIVVDHGEIIFHLRPRWCPGAFGQAALFIVGWKQNGEIFACFAELPKKALLPYRICAKVDLCCTATGTVRSSGYYTGSRYGGRLVLQKDDLEVAERAFAKLARRFGFFDEAGWVEIGIR